MKPEPQFVVFHRAGPKWRRGAAPFEQDGAREHIAHYRAMLETGKLLLGGPFMDEDGGGMMIAQKGVGLEELADFAARDPAVESGLLSVEIRPWFIGMSAGA